MLSVNLEGRRVEIWGGVECTINRVHDHYRSQLQASGHDRRVSDLDLFAQLGLARLRYPVLWEQVAPVSLEQPDWRWTDERLARLRELNIEPIAGLLHHGSGPAYTNLLDAQFPSLFARYAQMVAQRYPWIRCYTPINEPLTTARFSCLYGHWYPHQRNDRALARALLNETVATVRAMECIRQVNPEAQLIQTDDLGETFSTPLLRYQADFDNERRWLSWDLLCGKVNRHHPLRSYLEESGIGSSELDWLLDHPCVPSMIGINHYVTSDRMLHEDRGRFARHTHGGNGRHRFADIEAVRVLPDYQPGFARVIEQAWARYALPIALTEVHLGCSREEQLRWLHTAWRAADQAANAGANVVAITPWALLGSYDWDSLLTIDAGHYEPGAFDVRGDKPRPTALASLITSLARGVSLDQARFVHEPGWWERPTRMTIPIREDVLPAVKRHHRISRPLLIAGAGGTLGRALTHVCDSRAMTVSALKRNDFDICNMRAVEDALAQMKPWAVINAAGYEPHARHRDPQRCLRANVEGPTVLAEACARRNIPLVTFSSDAVFGGESSQPYTEASNTKPADEHGANKLRAEESVRRLHPASLIVRSSAFIGGWSDFTYFNDALRRLAQGEHVAVASNTVSPTYVVDLAEASLDLLIDAEHGIWHLVSRGESTWKSALEITASRLGIDASRLSEIAAAEPRGRFRAMSSTRGLIMPSLEDALERFARDAERFLIEERRATAAS